MDVQFRRIGKRRYSVSVHRTGQPTLEMTPAPGYDDLMPHDLLHFVVERELGIRRGIFGQLAAGGTAGTFHLGATASGTRERSREARGLARRGSRLARRGAEDCARSERAAQACHDAWTARANASAGARARAGAAVGRRSSPMAGAAGVLPGDQLERVCSELDALSAAWARLEVGQALTLVWTDAARRTDGADGVRPNKALQLTAR